MVDVGSPPVFTWIVYTSTWASLILAQVVAWRGSISSWLLVQRFCVFKPSVGVLVQRNLQWPGWCY
ncbi:MAG: hypothetical protein WA730_06815, partial [Pseudolabrys sp.]